ncbi:MAG: hypothetical protein KDA50_13305 [Rhodobacteraceae bacterium]|nr:hypothetical protein [Paracoccaceae bacterium]
MTFDMGADVDVLTITAASVITADTIDVSLGSDADTFFSGADIQAVDRASLSLGADNDLAEFDAGSLWSGAYVLISAGGGADDLLIEGDITAAATPVLAPASQGGIRPGDLVDTQRLVIDMGAGQDDVIVARDAVLSGATEFRLGAGDDTVFIDTLTSQTATDAMLIDGEAGSDAITLQTAGSLAGTEARDYVINVLDSGLPEEGEDVLTIDGTADPDVFLLRRMSYNPQFDLPNVGSYDATNGAGAAFVALLHGTEAEIRAGQSAGTPVERINYDRSINGRLQINTRAGADLVAVDDNAAITTIDGGEGDDTFQIGQLYGSERDYNSVADFDAFDQATELTTRGYLSRGASLPMLIQGDIGNDTFTVYSNKSPVRLEGNDGDDDFIVRAFALSSGNSIAEGTEILGGSGDDEIKYNINAPVNIDGGSGFDEVVVLGTELNDTFVITEDGVYGAGLNVQVSGREESIEIDGLEGDDTFYVLSTQADVGYTIIGGLGHDLFELAGDVDPAGVISRDLEGRSSAVLHGIDTTVAGRDTAFDTLFVPGLNLNVADSSEGQVQIDTGGDLVVDEATANSASVSYTVALAGAGALTAPVYVTVSAALTLVREREGEADLYNAQGVTGASVLIALTDPNTDPNVQWLNAATLTFTAAGAANAQTVWVRAEDDLRSEGTRDVTISHSVISADGTYDQVDVPDVIVTVFDDERPAIVIQKSELLVLEGSTHGLTDSYEVGLSAAPTSAVTIELDFDTAQLAISSADTRFNATNNTLTFAAGDTGPVLLNVAAIDDTLDESPVAEIIRHTVLTAGADYANAEQVDVDVAVYDNDAPGVLVQETGGDTKVDALDPADTDTYTIRLTTAVAAGKIVTVNVAPDGQVLASTDGGTTYVDATSVATIVFDDTNWFTEQVVTLKANPSFVPDPNDQPRKVFAPQPHLVNRLRGPIEILGGESGADRSLKPAILLPGETDAPLNDVNIIFDETTGIDRVNVYNDSSDTDETVTITGTNVFFEGMNQAIQFTETQSDGSTSTVTFDAGITYGDVEILEVLNGRGDDTVLIESTLTPTAGSTHGGITIVHGGGGSDDITVTGGGGDASPLVIFGDTSADGIRYSGTSDTPNGNGVTFLNPGADTINASLSTAGVVIDGGFGDDQIWGSQGDDQIAGREGNDTIHAEAGDDHVYGDGGFDIDPGSALPDTLDPDTVPFALDTRLRILTAVVGRETRGEDTIFGGQGNDIILGDDGVIELLPDTLRLIDQHLVQKVFTVNETVGGADIITDVMIDTAGPVERNIIFGGHNYDVDYDGSGQPTGEIVGNDVITTAGARDIVFGDHGVIDFNVLDGDIAEPDLIYSTSPGEGGGDVISTGVETDIVIGGTGGDVISAGEDGDALLLIPADVSPDIVFGDNGALTFTTAGVLTYAETTATGVGGADTITTGGGSDLVFGGTDGDSIGTGAANYDDIVLGDEGLADFTDSGVLIQLLSTNEATGGTDTVFTGDGSDIVIGGAAGDMIDAGTDAGGDTGMDLVLGDSGEILFTTAGVITFMQTTAPSIGGSDVITTGGNRDRVLGGAAGDRIDLGSGHDVAHGDNGQITFTLGADDLIETTDNDIGGADIIYGRAGDDLIIGGTDDDRIDGGSERDLIIGDNADLDRVFGDVTSPRFKALSGTSIYDISGSAPGIAGEVMVTGSVYDDPDGTPDWAEFDITFEDNTDTTTAGFYGDDYIAGGTDNDMIFGQLGDDVIQGDGRIEDVFDPADSLPDVGFARDAAGLIDQSVFQASFSTAGDGDDYIEGNGGADLIFGNLGQDDIIGGSSDLFSLTNRNQRPDGQDVIFGGSGDLIERNNFGVPNAAFTDEASLASDIHARDADAILGDNGNIYRLVGINSVGGSSYLSFAYDIYDPALKIVPRAMDLLDYTAGGAEVNVTSAALDIGAADEIHGESGDDTIYAMLGNDVVFGEAQDDDIMGGTGNDWISGGTGIDGVLGDDGRLFTARNGTAEALYGLAATTETFISTPGNVQQATINVTGELTKYAHLSPFDPDQDRADVTDLAISDPVDHDDIIYGGLGNDFLHGGAGDDAMSGAEALPLVASDDGTTVSLGGYDRPFNPGNALGFAADATRSEEFYLYDEFDPRSRIFVGGAEFLLNFNEQDLNAPVDPRSVVDVDPTIVTYTDGDDRIFGDLGNDWIVGGTGRDNAYGGYGNDLINMDDDLSTNAGLNDAPDPDAGYEDRAYGGAGRDVLIANTGGDRLIDWAGEFNSYIVPFAPFGLATVSRGVNPQLQQFLLDLSEADGADFTRAADTGASAVRNGEPEGELGMVIQKDRDWQDQTGAPDDPQPGNIPGGPRDVLRSSNFNVVQGGGGNGGGNTANTNFDGTVGADGFSPDTGTWSVQNGALQVAPTQVGGDAVAVLNVDHYLPSYFEVIAQINAVKPVGGFKANAYVVFDYVNPQNFKFAGVNVSNDKLEIGYRDASGWHVVDQTNAKLKPDRDYDMLVAINGLTATVVIDGTQYFSYAFAPRHDVDGNALNLNAGGIGIAGNNSKAEIDNVVVQILRPETSFSHDEDFKDGVADFFAVPTEGSWTITTTGQAFAEATGLNADGAAQYTYDLSIDSASYLELGATLDPAGLAGFIFDATSPDRYKFVALDAAGDQVLMGYYTSGRGMVVEASANFTLNNGAHDLILSLKGTTASVTVDGQAVLGHVYNAVTVDGGFGLLSFDAGTLFYDASILTSDPDLAALGTGGNLVLAAGSQTVISAPALTDAELAPVVEEAKRRWAPLLTPEQNAILNGLTVEIAELGGAVLSRWTGEKVLIDATAGGAGWFVDLTPEDDSEFANGGAPAGVDLLTAVLHELGHALGDSGHDQTGLMAPTLGTGERRLPSAGLITPNMAPTASDLPISVVVQSEINVQIDGGDTAYFDDASGTLTDADGYSVTDDLTLVQIDADTWVEIDPVITASTGGKGNGKGKGAQG